MKVEMKLTLELDDNEWGNSETEMFWLVSNVLDADLLSLHSNEIGDSVGKVIDIDNIKINKPFNQ